MPWRSARRCPTSSRSCWRTHDVPRSVTVRVWRGDATGGEFDEYDVAAEEGEVVLDVVHRLQATQANDLAVRWNCKAGKCGSCSAEVNGVPRLMCMTRMNVLPPDEPITITPLRTFPHHPRPRDRRVVQLREGEAGAGVQAPAPRARRHLPHAPGGHRPRPGVPQVHRVLPLPERVPRHPRPRGEQADLRRSPHVRPVRRARDAPPRHQRPA